MPELRRYQVTQTYWENTGKKVSEEDTAYDEKGQVKIGVKTKEEAIAKHEEIGLYITRVIDKAQMDTLDHLIISFTLNIINCLFEPYTRFNHILSFKHR